MEARRTLIAFFASKVRLAETFARRLVASLVCRSGEIAIAGDVKTRIVNSTIAIGCAIACESSVSVATIALACLSIAV